MVKPGKDINCLRFSLTNQMRKNNRYDKQDHTAPTVLRIKATNSVFGNFKIYNAPRAHMALTSANNVVLENIYLHTVSSSKNPAKNTDALDVSSSSNIVFRNSELNVGDDCTAINGGKCIISKYMACFNNLRCQQHHLISHHL